MQRDVAPAGAGIEHPHADFRQTQRLNLAEHVVKPNPSRDVNLADPPIRLAPDARRLARGLLDAKSRRRDCTQFEIPRRSPGPTVRATPSGM